MPERRFVESYVNRVFKAASGFQDINDSNKVSAHVFRSYYESLVEFVDP